MYFTSGHLEVGYIDVYSTSGYLLGGGAGLIASAVSAYSPGPASLTAATRNSYG